MIKAHVIFPKCITVNVSLGRAINTELSRAVNLRNILNFLINSSYDTKTTFLHLGVYSATNTITRALFLKYKDIQKRYPVFVVFFMIK